MSIPKHIREELADKEFAHAYVDEFLNVSIATQLKVLREQQDLTQEELGDLAGMKQERISVLENVNYSSWSINTLRKLAKALDVVLKVSFEAFGSRLSEMNSVTRRSLERITREEELASYKRVRSPEEIATPIIYGKGPIERILESEAQNSGVEFSEHFIGFRNARPNTGVGIRPIG